MSIIERYNKSICGDIEVIGNSLLVSKRDNGERSFIAFTTKNTPKSINSNSLKSCESFLTCDYNKNFASTSLTLPINTQVCYAEIVVSGTFSIGNSGLSEKELETPIKLILPNGFIREITPDFKTSMVTTVNTTENIKFYMKSADVTGFIRNSGLYALMGVPCYLDNQNRLSTEFASCGFSLTVIYKCNNTKCKNRVIYYIGALPSFDEESETKISFENINQKESSTAKLLLSGCCQFSKEGASSADFSSKDHESNNSIVLSAKNNSKDNFFASQINNRNGYIDTLGSFGTYNHSVPKIGCKSNNIGRDGYFVTTVNLPTQILADKSSGTLRVAVKNNFVLLNSAALCINEDNIEVEGDNSMSDEIIEGSSVSMKNGYDQSDLSKIEAFKNGNFSKFSKQAEIAVTNLKEANPALYPKQDEFLCQSLYDKLYAYNINKIISSTLEYKSATVFEFKKMPALVLNYLITVKYLDNSGDTQISVKSGSVSFLDLSSQKLNECSVKVHLSSAEIGEHEVIVKGCVKLYSNKKQDV